MWLIGQMVARHGFCPLCSRRAGEKMGRSAEERPPDRKDPPIVTRRPDGDGEANELPAQAALTRNEMHDHFKRVLPLAIEDSAGRPPRRAATAPRTLPPKGHPRGVTNSNAGALFIEKMHSVRGRSGKV